MNKVKFSIIIACYNAERNLPKIIKWLQEQKYDNFEVHIIDDGSNDKSGEIAEDIARLDCRFHVYHKKNGGPASARNIGILKSKGEYICFCDSDDEVSQDWLEAFEKMPSADLLSQGYISNGIIKHTETKYYYKGEFKDWLHSSYEAFTWGFLWCKAFKRNIIEKNKILFNENVRFQEDLEFILNYMCNCNTLSNLDKGYYLYNTTLNSKNKYSYHRRMLGTALSINHLRDMGIYDDDILILYFQRLMIEDIFISYKLNDNKNQIKDRIKIIRETFPNGLNSKNCIGFTKKMFYYIFKYSNFIILHFTMKILCKIIRLK